MKKPAIYLLLAILLYACGDKPSEKQISQKAEKPNIIFLMVDDLGKEWLSCYGADNIETPQIDALAKSGMLFHNAWSMPQCTPSRLSLLTGQYPFRHGWVNHWDVPRWGAAAHYDESVNPSLVKDLKQAGYKTCIAGKWQIDDFRVEPDALSRNGFDEWCMWTGYETGVPASAERYQEPYLFTSEGSKTYEGKFGPDVFRDFIIDFIEQNKDSSFFVYFPMVLTHTPLVNTPDEVADTKLGKHKAMVRYTDKITGQLVKALEKAGVRENTLFVWTTDNGSTRGITGSIKGREIPGGKMRMLESGINSPFIASWPKVIPAGSESDALIDFSDVFPTFLELAGAESCDPKSKDCKLQGYDIDGRSFKGVFTEGENYKGRDWILAMGGGNNARRTEKGIENQYVFRDRVVRDKRYKLYIGLDRKVEKFIDLWADPDEQVNLIDSLNTAQRRRSFEKLAALLPNFPPQDQDPKYKPNPPQEWDVEITAKSQEWKQ
ncbi:MAG: sulfatase-like hydrolase/transferase [Bacteroidia bacterium]|nr:sulfatase-like hydrolase/transferase [Bacteroidia bacterium]